jgi:hypothetical protein
LNLVPLIGGKERCRSQEGDREGQTADERLMGSHVELPFLAKHDGLQFQPIIIGKAPA